MYVLYFSSGVCPVYITKSIIRDKLVDSCLQKLECFFNCILHLWASVIAEARQLIDKGGYENSGSVC